MIQNRIEDMYGKIVPFSIAEKIYEALVAFEKGQVRISEQLMNQVDQSYRLFMLNVTGADMNDLTYVDAYIQDRK